MPKSQFLNLEEIVRSAIEAPHERAGILLVARNLRGRAEEALELAEIFESSHTKQIMREIAATYEKLAQRLEQDVGPPNGRVAPVPLPQNR
jgi:hypothetical protein